MKKTLVSLAAVAALTTGAMAADKGIDFVTTGQAVIYYETETVDVANDAGLFDQDNSKANVGVQLNLDADLGNNFTFGSQLSYLGTAGLEKNLVGNVKQSAGGTLTGSTTDELSLTKIFVAKKVGNTTVKMGRQELPKSLSPLAFTEGWNVFKNTFDAVLAVNTDIPDTTLVGAYVSGGTGHTLGTVSDLSVSNDAGADVTVTDGAYMITAQNKSIPMTTITASYYHLSNAQTSTVDYDGADAIWLDAKVAGKDLPLGLKVGLQGGTITTDAATLADTTAMGAKVSLAPVDALTVCLAYTTVDGDDDKVNVAVKNTGGIKTPLYTQMVYNQDAIALDADTFLVKAVYNTGDYGKVIAQYASTSAGKSNLNGSENDYNEFDLIYKVKAGGVQYFAAYVMRDFDAVNTDIDIVRFWARVAF